MPRNAPEDSVLPATLKRARKAAGFSNANALLDAVNASGREAPSYSTYAQWESGKVTPRDDTLEPVVAYHRERGTWAEVEQESSDLAAAIRELTSELRDSREDRKSMQADIEGLKSLVGSLAAQLQLEQELTTRLARHVQLDSAGSAR